MGKARKTREQLQNVYQAVMPALREFKAILFFGSLLGYVREDNFIEGDDDVDILIERKDMKDVVETLKSKGYKLGVINNSFLQVTTSHGPFDIYVYDIEDDVVKIKWERKTIPLSTVLPVEKVKYFGFSIYVPKNRKETVRKLYGEKWMIPLR